MRFPAFPLGPDSTPLCPSYQLWHRGVEATTRCHNNTTRQHDTTTTRLSRFDATCFGPSVPHALDFDTEGPRQQHNTNSTSQPFLRGALRPLYASFHFGIRGSRQQQHDATRTRLSISFICTYSFGPSVPSSTSAQGGRGTQHRSFGLIVAAGFDPSMPLFTSTGTGGSGHSRIPWLSQPFCALCHQPRHRRVGPSTMPRLPQWIQPLCRHSKTAQRRGRAGHS